MLSISSYLEEYVVSDEEDESVRSLSEIKEEIEMHKNIELGTKL